MSAAAKKPTPPNTLGRKQPTPQRSTSPAQASTPPSAPSANGVASSPSGRGTARPLRAGPRRPGPGSSNLSSNNVSSIGADGSEDDGRAETTALIGELKDRLRKAETASEEYQRQLGMLQARLDGSLDEQSKLEERLHEGDERIEELESHKRDTTRQKREMEGIYESERTAMIRDKEAQHSKEEELQTAIQRLKETLAQREMRSIVDDDRRMSRSPSLPRKSCPDIENGQFAPPSTLHRSDSKSNSRLVMQKDRVIESLRLELAEAQIKQVEMENMGGGRMQELERILLETRMTNARLMEDNESFQLLLGEKTLNGDFSKANFMQETPSHGQSNGLGSLAEELESAEGESENYRRLEHEAKSLKDQNKALTLYIENIIGRLLQHKDFETILDKTPDLMSGVPKPSAATTEKDLPPPPPPKDGDVSSSLLQRARSVVGGPARRPRPMSQMISPTATPAPTANENPSTAPSIPLGRSSSTRASSHRRTHSEVPSPAAAVVNQMYRGPSHGSGGPTSPGISPGITSPRTSFFAQPTTNSSLEPAARSTSSTQVPTEAIDSSNTSAISKHSGEVPSPPRTSAGNTNYTGAVMTQNRLRPLRLVQENKETEVSGEDEAARKKANRGSWMGWFNRGKDEMALRNVSDSSLRE